ncbi:hypothetical protein EV356DRAFT_502724 [Viridothelium virens]|uniref:Uncharacterized protein n=1 Tax=Viridothelium virens TaxID=1048519 RepID=A0A6A6H7U4_VIRVR|nr:hypothetical protein EV356DRAFT_502724 [Viridothelium virens]
MPSVFVSIVDWSALAVTPLIRCANVSELLVQSLVQRITSERHIWLQSEEKEGKSNADTGLSCGRQMYERGVNGLVACLDVTGLKADIGL